MKFCKIQCLLIIFNKCHALLAGPLKLSLHLMPGVYPVNVFMLRWFVNLIVDRCYFVIVIYEVLHSFYFSL